MAEEEKKEEAPSGAEGEIDSVAAEDKGFLKKILGNKLILIGVGVVLLLAIGGGAFFISGRSSGKGKNKAEAKQEHKEGEEKGAEEKTGEEKHGESKPEEGAKTEPEKPAEEAKNEEPPPEEEAEEEASSAEGAEGAAGAITLKLEPLVVNIFDKNAIHYLKLQIEAVCTNQEVVEEIKVKMSQIKDLLLFIVSDTSLREVLSTGGKMLLKEDMKSALNKILKKGKIKEIYFTDFTVQ